MSKYYLFFFFLLIACNQQDEEFVKIIETNSQGEIIGNDILDQWSPRTETDQFEDISYPLSSKPAYPNPVNIEETVSISFALNSDRDVLLEILDKPGNIVDTLGNHMFSAGYHTYSWAPKHTGPSNHIYQIRITSGENEIYGNIKVVE